MSVKTGCIRFGFWLVLAWAACAWAGQKNPLAGPAFSGADPELPMPREWIEKAIDRVGWGQGIDLAVSLDQHLYTALLPAIEEYGRQHGLKLVVREGTCGVTSGLLTDKAVDIGGICCPPGPADRLPGLRFHTVGIVALAIFAHPDNPIDNISLDEARRLFQGQIRNWSALPAAKGFAGSGLPVHPVARLHCRQRPGHWRTLLDNEDLFGLNLKEVNSIAESVAAVATDPQAIGGFEMLHMLEMKRQQFPTKVLAIDGVSPRSREQLQAGRYPLYFVFNITTWTASEKAATQAAALVQHLLRAAEGVPEKFGIVAAARLRAAGWQFAGDELVGGPPGTPP